MNLGAGAPPISRSTQRQSLYLTVFLAQLGTTVAVPILPTLRQAFGVSVATVALTTSVWGLARLLIDLPAGAAAHRLAPGRMLLFGTVVIGCGSTLSALAPTFGVFLVGQAISGAGSGVVSVTAIVRLVALSEPGRRGRTLAIYQAMLQGGSSLSPSTAGFASATLGWPAAFGIAAIGAFGASLVVGLTGTLRSEDAAEQAGPAPPNDTPTPRAEARSRPRSSLVLSLLVVNFVSFAIMFTNGGLARNALPLFGGLEIGLGPAVIGLILSASTTLRFVVGLIAGSLSDRYGRHLILLAGFVLLAVACTVFPLASGLVGFVLASFFLAGTRLGNALTVALLSDHVGRRSTGRWVGVNRFVADVGLLTGPAVTGVLIEGSGFSLAFWVTAMLAAAAAAAVAVDLVVNGRPGLSCTIG